MVNMNIDKIVFLYFNQDEEENRRDDVKEEKKAQSSRSVKSFIHTVTLHCTGTKTQCFQCFNAEFSLLISLLTCIRPTFGTHSLPNLNLLTTVSYTHNLGIFEKTL